MLPLNTTNLSLFAAIIICLRLIYYIIYHAFFSPLSRYPGPLITKFTRLPLTIDTVRGQPHKLSLKWHKKYGPVVRISPGELSYATPEVWRDGWGHRPGHHEEFQKTFFQSAPNGVRNIFSADRENHTRIRRLLSHAFSAQGLAAQEHRIQYLVELFVSQLTQQSLLKPTQDMVRFYNWTTFDVIGDLAFGEPFGCLESISTHPWVVALFRGFNYGLLMSQLNRYGLSFLAKFVAPKKLAEGRANNFKYASDKIEKRVDQGKLDEDKGDFWDYVLKKGNDPDEGGMSREEMKVNAGVLVLAGSESTATLLSGTTFHLLRNPQILDKVKTEVRDAFNSSEEITIETVSRLSYLLAVFNEAMRIYPPVPSTVTRVVPPGGDTVDGKFLPGGIIIQAAGYAMCNVDYNFAKPDEFHPERWLDDRPDEFENDNRTAFQPFSYGPRNCMGKNLAFAEMRLVMAKTLFNFDLSIPKGVEDWGGWQKSQRALPLWQKPPLWVDVKPRQIERELEKGSS